MALLGERNFRVFFTGYATSLLGSAMSPIATTFAVLGQHGSPADLGYVLAAGVVPQVLFMIGGGVLADRLGRSAPPAWRGGPGSRPAPVTGAVVNVVPEIRRKAGAQWPSTRS